MLTDQDKATFEHELATARVAGEPVDGLPANINDTATALGGLLSAAGIDCSLDYASGGELSYAVASDDELWVDVTNRRDEHVWTVAVYSNAEDGNVLQLQVSNTVELYDAVRRVAERTDEP